MSRRLLAPRSARRGQLVALAAAFSPLQIANLAAWYRADDPGITIATGVSLWPDKSGNGDANRNAVQGTGANQPAFSASNASYNNQPTITFASTQYLATGTWSAAIAQPCTTFVVGNATAGGSKYFFDSISSSQFGNFNGASGASMLSAAALASGVQATSPSVIYSVFNSPSSRIGVNAATAQATGVSNVGGAAGLTIGAFQGHTNQLSGPIAELLVYTRALTVGEIAQVLAYLGTRYAIAIGA